jgi:hypothetical protein
LSRSALSLKVLNQSFPREHGTGSADAADGDGGVAVGAVEVGDGGALEDEPGDAEGVERGEAGGVSGCGRAEVLLCGLGDGPRGGERGRDGGFAAVFGVVGKGRAFGDGAEALGVFAGGVDVVGVEGEEGVFGGVVADPEEGLEPGVSGVRVGVLVTSSMWGELGKVARAARNMGEARRAMAAHQRQACLRRRSSPSFAPRIRIMMR